MSIRVFPRLTAWSVASIPGLLAFTTLRERAVSRAIDTLASGIAPRLFARTFGTGIERLEQFVATNAVALAELVELTPQGAIGPTPHLYTGTMRLMAALPVIGLICTMP